MRAEGGSNLPDLNELMEHQGGMGKFQYFGFVLMVMAINASGVFAYNLGYLLLYPVHECGINQGNGVINYFVQGSQDYEDYCNREYICEN